MTDHSETAPDARVLGRTGTDALQQLVKRWRKEQRGYEAGATLAALEPEVRAMNRASASVCKRILDDLEACPAPDAHVQCCCRIHGGALGHCLQCPSHGTPPPTGPPALDVAHVDLSSLPEDTYVSYAQEGDCLMCGARKDLRMGCCFPCSEYVEGRPIEGGHELWDRRNPAHKWRVSIQ